MKPMNTVSSVCSKLPILPLCLLQFFLLLPCLIGLLYAVSLAGDTQIRLKTMESNLSYEISKAVTECKATTEELQEEQSDTAAIPEVDTSMHILQVDDKLWMYEGALTDNYVMIHIDGQRYALFMPATSEQGSVQTSTTDDTGN